MKRGDIVTLGQHKLLCGDSTSFDNVRKLIGNDDKAEICFTSPPYLNQRTYKGIKLDLEQITKFIPTVADKCNYLCINLGYSRRQSEVNCYWNDYIREANISGLKLLSWNIWDKGMTTTISSSTAMFGIQHEWIFVFGYKTKPLNRTIKNKYAGQKFHGKKGRERDGSFSTSLCRATVKSHKQLSTVTKLTHDAVTRFKHPAKFPVSLPQTYIEAMTQQGDIVYEPFAGSGSTLIACENTNRKCYAIEIEPEYCDIIIDRWEKHKLLT